MKNKKSIINLILMCGMLTSVLFMVLLDSQNKTIRTIPQNDEIDLGKLLPNQDSNITYSLRENITLVDNIHY